MLYTIIHKVGVQVVSKISENSHTEPKPFLWKARRVRPGNLVHCVIEVMLLEIFLASFSAFQKTLREVLLTS